MKVKQSVISYAQQETVKNKNLCTVFTGISAGVLIKFFVPQMRCLFEGSAYLKTGKRKREVSLIVPAKFMAFTTELYALQEFWIENLMGEW